MGCSGSTGARTFLRMTKDLSIRPGSDGENAVGKGKSSSRAHCRPFSGAIALLVVDSTERITTPAAQTSKPTSYKRFKPSTNSQGHQGAW
jgi:hypothetical protein